MKRFTLLFFIMPFILVGCNRNHDDIKKYIENVKAMPVEKVEPLPAAMNYIPYQYQSTKKRSPFSPVVRIQISSSLQPDKNRKREELESFSMDTLRMVGTLDYQNKLWALIASPDGLVHRVTEGNYIGKNYGKIISIRPNAVTVLEIVEDGRGGWTQRKSSIETDKK